MMFGIEYEGRYLIGNESPTEELNEEVRDEAAAATGLDVWGYTGNGGRAYLDDMAEFCTPECDDPRDTIRYNNANRSLLLYAIGTVLLQAHAANGDVTSAYHYNRVIDGRDHTWGIHDNYGLTKEQLKILAANLRPGTPIRQFMVDFAATRIIYTGAGLASSGGWHFSQKRYPGLTEEKGSQLGTFLYALPENGRGTQARLEWGDNDTPWSDWSGVCRLVTMAGAIQLVTSRYPLQHLDVEQFPRQMTRPGRYNAFNEFDIDDDGFMMFADPTIPQRAADFQLRVLDTLLGDAIRHGVDVGERFPDEIESVHDYLELFKAVARRERPVSDLKDRVDWAAKAELSRQRYVRLRQDNKELRFRRVSREVDVTFDTTIFKIEPSEEASGRTIELAFAPGDRLRRSGRLGPKPDMDAERRAMTTPPHGVPERRVAALRANTRPLKQVTWTRATFLKGGLEGASEDYIDF